MFVRGAEITRHMRNSLAGEDPDHRSAGDDIPTFW